MYKKTALLISGGGSWGAYGGGTLARINKNYDTVVGVSTGALLAPFVALKDWENLKVAYTSVTDDDIFDNCWYKPKPFTKNGKIKKSAILISILLGQKTIATSNVLRETINMFFPEYLFNELKEKNKEIFVGTQNYAEIPSKIHYFSSLTEDYEDFKDWMWCSANFPLFTSLVRKSWVDDQSKFHVGLWSDGGLTDLIGIEYLIGKGFTDIDILLHRNKINDKFEGNEINNFIDYINTTITAMRYEIEFEFLYKLINKLNYQGTNVRIFWLPRKLNQHPLVFDKELMLSWWNEGFKTAYDENRIDIFKSKIKN